MCRWSALLAASALMVAACSGGSDDDATSVVDETASTDDEEGDRTGTPADFEALQLAEPDVVDDTADTRCDRLGYPCSWSDVPEADFERSHQLSIDLQDITLTADDPAAGLDAALERLRDVDDLAEMIVDREGLTGLMFRLDGMPEMYALTALAGPVGQPEELDLAALGVDIAATDGDVDTPVTSEPQGIRSLPRAYQPTGGPIVPKTALVIDPYASAPIECPRGSPAGATCRITGDGRVEGSVVNAILDAPEQITSTYAPALDDPSQVGGWDPILGPALSDFDLVHIASHGSSGCGGLKEGWVASWSSLGESRQLPDRCYSMSTIGTYNKARYASLPPDQRRIPAGLSLAGDKWVARDDYFVGKFKPTAIVYLSSCTSADGSLFASGRYGSFVGWHSYARFTTAAESAITFWNLMATEGLEFDQAIEQLDDAGLTSTMVVDATNGGAAAAELASGGKNLRARDVITLTLDGQDPEGQVLRVEGMPGDGQPEVFPARQQQVTFEVEGVRDGTAANVQIEFRYDGKKLDVRNPITLDTNGTIVDEGDDWATWQVTVIPSTIEIPDTTTADYAAGAVPTPLEVRAFVDGSEYTADLGNVRLGTQLASNGPLPIFTELAAVLGSSATVTGNDLRIEFDSAGGPATGFFRVDMVASGLDVGFWQYELTGTYDPASGRISGDFSGEARVRVDVIGISEGDSGSGTWEGTVDLDSRTLAAVVSIADRPQNYVGAITAVTAS